MCSSPRTVSANAKTSRRNQLALRPPNRSKSSEAPRSVSVRPPSYLSSCSQQRSRTSQSTRQALSTLTLSRLQSGKNYNDQCQRQTAQMRVKAMQAKTSIRATVREVHLLSRLLSRKASQTLTFTRTNNSIKMVSTVSS